MTTTGDERRTAVGDRRRYNRRAPDASPPYYEVFERLAIAVEQIAVHLTQQSSAPPPPRKLPHAREPKPGEQG